MRRKSGPEESAEQHIKNIRRVTRKRYSTEKKIRIVLSGLRGEHSIAELCRREGIAQNLYYSWSKEFLAAGKNTGEFKRRNSGHEYCCFGLGSEQEKGCKTEKHVGICR